MHSLLLRYESEMVISTEFIDGRPTPIKGVLVNIPLLEWEFTNTIITGYGDQEVLSNKHDEIKGHPIGSNSYLDVDYRTTRKG